MGRKGTPFPHLQFCTLTTAAVSVCMRQSSVVRQLKSMQDTMSLSLGHLMDRVRADTKVYTAVRSTHLSVHVSVWYVVVTVFRRNVMHGTSFRLLATSGRRDVLWLMASSEAL